MTDILLVAKLDEGREHKSMFIFSCGQHPSAFAGLGASAVYFTDAAERHPAFEKVAATLEINLAKYRP